MLACYNIATICDGHAAESDALRQRVEELEGEREKLLDECAHFDEAWQQASAERDALKAENALLQKQNDLVFEQCKEMGRISDERWALKDERDALKAEVDHLTLEDPHER